MLEDASISDTIFKNGGMVLGKLQQPNGVKVEPQAGTIILYDLLLISSQELKKDVSELSSEEAFELIRDIEPVKFIYKNDKQNKANLGFIAEKLPDIFTDSTHKTARFFEIISAVTKVVQDQQKEINSLKNKINSLEAKSRG